jgi:hypothetical protein
MVDARLPGVTGAEVAAVGKAVEVLGIKALGQDKQTRAELLEAARETGELKAAARTAAARVAVQERIKLRLLKPFARMIGVSEDYFKDTFPEEMAAKTAHIPDEHMITPTASIAVPAMQGLSYSFEEPDLKELYLNLLTIAVDDRRADDAHPAFVEVIKQLSAEEARLLNQLLTQRVSPIVRLRNHREETGGYAPKMTHLLNVCNIETAEPAELPQMPAWVDNWVRLGLVEVSYGVYLVEEARYDWVDSRPEYLRIAQEPDIERLEIQKGVISRTAFGERFLRAVAPATSAVMV